MTFQVMYFSTILAFDHLRHRIHIISNILVNRGLQSLEAKYNDAILRIDQIEKRLTAPISLPVPGAGNSMSEPVSNLTEDRYHSIVRRAKEHIQAGDIFQVVLSQRLSMEVSCDPL